MSTSAVSTTSLFQELQSFYQSRQTDLAQLGSDLQSGNLTAAQQDFTTLAALGQGGPFASSEPFSNSSRAQAFNAIGTALQSGDLSGAQTAFAALTGNRNNGATAATTPSAIVNLSTPLSTTSSTQTSAATTTTAASIYQQLQAFRQTRTADLAQLGQDIQAGNLTAAQQDFATLTALGQTGPGGNGQLFQQTGRAQDFQAIGQALQSGDLAGAQSAFTTLSNTLGSQNQQAQNAISAYSGVIEIIINAANPSTSTNTGVASSPTVGIAQPVTTTSTGTSPSTTSTSVPLPGTLQGPAIGPDPVVSNPVAPGRPLAPIATPISTGTGTSLSTAPGGFEIVINLGQATSSTSAGSTSAGSTSGTSALPEIEIDLGAASGTNSSTGSTAPELVINLNPGNASTSTPANELTITLSNSSSGEQLSITGAQGQNGNSAEPIVFNLNPQNNYEFILNFLNSSSTTTSNNALSVSA